MINKFIKDQLNILSKEHEFCLERLITEPHYSFNHEIVKLTLAIIELKISFWESLTGE